jgi:hypothetical protein
MIKDGNAYVTVRGSLARIIQRITNTGGRYTFSAVTSEPGLLYRDPAGNLIAVYECIGWDGVVSCEFYRACDRADRSNAVSWRVHKPRTLGGLARFSGACDVCGGVDEGNTCCPGTLDAEEDLEAALICGIDPRES